MAHLSGTFVSSVAGKIKVTLFGKWTSDGGGRTSSNMTYSTAKSMTIAAVVNGVAVTIINPGAESSVGYIDYPVPGAVWAVSTQVVAQSFSSPGAFGFYDLGMNLILEY